MIFINLVLKFILKYDIIFIYVMIHNLLINIIFLCLSPSMHNKRIYVKYIFILTTQVISLNSK